MGVLSAGVLAGVVIGVALSLVWLIHVATRPRIPRLSRQPGTQVFRDADEHPDDETFDGMIILRLDFGLSFATAEALEERDPRADRRRAAGRVRSSWTSPAWTSSTPRAPRSCARSAGSPTHPAPYSAWRAIKPNIRAVLAADGVLDQIGKDHVHGNVDEAVEAQLATSV